jgi:DnaK suppressor protein
VEELTLAEKSLLKSQLRQMELDLEQQLSLAQDSVGVVNLDQTAVGRVSRVDALQQQSMALSLQHSAQQKLKKVKAALGAIDQENFGDCQRCDEPIGFPRLRSQAETCFCLNCQSKADKL